MRNKSLLLFAAVFFPLLASAGDRLTVAYAVKDTVTLNLDIYAPDAPDPDKPAVLFMFGGGFMSGNRWSRDIEAWANALNDDGFTVVSIDYRLGLKGVKLGGMKFVKALEKAIDIAVEDLYSATLFLLEHGSEYGIDANNLVISGSSAGAISVLQGEYEICNGGPLAAVLPEGFNYAGVMSFSGAVFDRHNPIRFESEPCPLLMFHGTADKLVTYKKIAAFNITFSGTNEIVKRLDKAGYPYNVYRYLDQGHEVAGYYGWCLDQEKAFIDAKVIGGSKAVSDSTIDDPAAPRPDWGKTRPSGLYK